MTALLAQVNDEMAMVVMAMLFFGIPIIAILTHHQRKMAEIIHSRHAEISPVVMDEVQRLRDEVSKLRTELYETTIALDDVRRAGPTVEERVRQ